MSQQQQDCIQQRSTVGNKKHFNRILYVQAAFSAECKGNKETRLQLEWILWGTATLQTLKSTLR